jgi:mannose-6-phosphate isomerase-like protein (cupin superfamily)
LISGYMTRKKSEGSFVDMAPGIKRRTMANGDKTVICEFRFTKGAVVPLHSHLYEQTGFLISGRLIFTIDDDEVEVTPGDSWCIKADVPHSAEVPEETVLIEAFSPVRRITCNN